MLIPPSLTRPTRTCSTRMCESPKEAQTFQGHTRDNVPTQIESLQIMIIILSFSTLPSPSEELMETEVLKN